MSKFFKYWFPVILYAGLIFWFSSLPAPSSLSLLPYGDKIGHFLEYALFGFFLFRACKNYGFKRKVFWTVFIGFIYALSDEIHQYFVPGREVSFSDVLFDILGVYLGTHFSIDRRGLKL